MTRWVWLVLANLAIAVTTAGLGLKLVGFFMIFIFYNPNIDWQGIKDYTKALSEGLADDGGIGTAE